MGKYYNLKENCSIQEKTKLKEITKGQRGNKYQKAKNSGKPFLKNYTGASSIQDVGVIKIMRLNYNFDLACTLNQFL